MKYALVIGNNQYNDPKLARLKTPAADAQALANVLSDQNIGSFDKVISLVNKTESNVSRGISTFLTNKRPEDLVLVYFSGHGILDDRGRLFLALKDTRINLLKATAIPAAFISDEMDSCRSRRQILILDCCNSGAFARGTKGEQKAVTEATFEGSGFGRVVLTASDAAQFAFEGDQTIETELSLFTHFLLEGLKTGEADTNNDGHVSLDEWYDYTYTQVLATTPKQIPNKWSYRQQGDLIIARNPFVKKKVVELPEDLLQLLENPYSNIREGAVKELGRLIGLHDTEMAQLVRSTLEKMEADDSRAVSQAAARLLSEFKKPIEERESIEIVEREKAAREKEERETTEKVARERVELEEAERQVAETVAREKERQEAAEKAKREKAEKEIAKKARLEAEEQAREKVAKEKAEREDAEKAACERAEKDAAEKEWFEKTWLEAEERARQKTAPDKEEHDAAERAAREKVERETAKKDSLEKAKRETAEKPKPKQAKSTPVEEKPARKASQAVSKELGTQSLQGKSGNQAIFWIIGFVVVVLMTSILSLNNRNTSQTLVPTSTQTSLIQVSVTPTETKTPEISKTPVRTSTPAEDFTSPPILGIGSTMISEKDEMKLLYVPAGEFVMGSDSSGEWDEKPAHDVDLVSFWIDQTEITNAMYAKCVDAGSCASPDFSKSSTRDSYYGNPEFNNYPVIYVSWNDAVSYCGWADRRLPSEAEWEKAARGTDERMYPWGNAVPNDTLLNFNLNVGDTVEAGIYQDGASPYGAYDMSGNVYEWVNDVYDIYPGGQWEPFTSYLRGTRVLRGGSWDFGRWLVRTTFRHGENALVAANGIGFRCARDVAP